MESKGCDSGAADHDGEAEDAHHRRRRHEHAVEPDQEREDRLEDGQTDDHVVNFSKVHETRVKYLSDVPRKNEQQN